MALTPHAVTFDAGDAARLAGFWAEALGLAVHEGATAEFAAVTGAGQSYLFFAVPEGKLAKNRVHLDLEAGHREDEVERLVRLGATRLDDHDDGARWTVMADPEGNEFCVVQSH
ncbi:VOC family protein [Georgenia subflava]|uniref:VOC family protein n=1 Tax=Georgenia subflava TaxID=1622177 RepID=A0A6N7EGN7_9MICO|nr:VOC family protein [Georgenia subflava]MPV35825.1 VOC family protein [Georgenia subflava]